MAYSFALDLMMWILRLRQNFPTLQNFTKSSSGNQWKKLTSWLRKCSIHSSINRAVCNKGHKFEPFVTKIAETVFNCIAVNLTRDANSLIHKLKKRKTQSKSSNGKRILKLTSGSSAANSMETISTELKTDKSGDCGQCKFCKDKKKFGGRGVLKQKCVHKEKKTKWCSTHFFFHILIQCSVCFTSLTWKNQSKVPTPFESSWGIIPWSEPGKYHLTRDDVDTFWVSTILLRQTEILGDTY